MKDYFAIIGVMAAITAASVFAAWSAFSEVEKSGDDLEVAGLQPISVPASDLPEANGADLKKKLQGSKKAMGTKPVITIEEIDPGDGRSIMSDHAKNGSMKKGMDKRNANISTKADRKNGKPDRASKESENFNPASPDSDDPGVIFGSRPEPFVSGGEAKIPEPMELLHAKMGLLRSIVNSQSGPAPHVLHGTWEVMPCHSSVGIVATRSFESAGMTHGTGPYYEIVQFYSDPENKVFGERTETTVYVSLDDKHMLAAVNPNTNLPSFSVLRKISSDIRGLVGTVDEISEDEDLPGSIGEIEGIGEIEEIEMESDQPKDESDMKKMEDTKKSDSAMKKTDAAIEKTDAAIEKMKKSVSGSKNKI